MLVLARKLNESIQIGEATVKVIQVRNGQVRLGIEADPRIPVLRSELLHERATQPAELVEA